MRNLPLYRMLAQLVQARANCNKMGNEDWFIRHGAKVEHLVLEYMPSGSGFDSGTALDFEKSTAEQLVFTTSFHHHDDSGYCGWSDHTVTVRPSLAFGFELSVSGRDRRDIKAYIGETFHEVLSREVQS